MDTEISNVQEGLVVLSKQENLFEIVSIILLASPLIRANVALQHYGFSKYRDFQIFVRGNDNLRRGYSLLANSKPNE